MTVDPDSTFATTGRLDEQRENRVLAESPEHNSAFAIQLCK